MATAADLGERGSARRCGKPDVGIPAVQVFIKMPYEAQTRDPVFTQTFTHEDQPGSAGPLPPRLTLQAFFPGLEGRLPLL